MLCSAEMKEHVERSREGEPDLESGNNFGGREGREDVDLHRSQYELRER
jgi:hypothetical protein